MSETNKRSYQHEVDVEIEDLVTHVHTEVVAEVISQVGERSSWTLEVCARYFQSLTVVGNVRVRMQEKKLWIL